MADGYSTSLPIVLNPFENAATFIMAGMGKSVGRFVEDQITVAAKMAQKSYDEAITTIRALKNVEFDVPTNPNVLPNLDFDFDYDWSVDPITKEDLGEITTWEMPPDPEEPTWVTLTKPSFPNFDPTYTLIVIPKPPDFDAGDVPEKDFEITDPDFPDFIERDPPASPQFLALTLPSPPDVVIPTFETEFPTFDLPAPPLGIEWTEPVYTPEIIDEVLTQIRVFLAGGTGIRPDVENAIFERSSEREDRITHQAVQEVTDDFAGRGFVAPPGMMQKRIDATRAERDLKKQGLAREVTIKAMDVEIENLRFAVQQGIAAEELYVRIFMAATDRAFQVARSVVEFGIQIYQMQVTLFQARLEAVRVEVIAYEAQVRGALALVELYKALIDAEQTKAEINMALVERYKAEVSVLSLFIQQYDSQVRAEGVKMEAQKIRVQAYGEEVDAYSARVGAEKLKFDAYDSQVRGELGKASITESEARAYAAEVGAIAQVSSAEARISEAQVARYKANIDWFSTEVGALVEKSKNELMEIDFNLKAYGVNIQRFAAEAGLVESQGRVEVAAWAGGIRNQIEAYRSKNAAFAVDAQNLIETAKMALGALETSGGMASTMNAGALSAMHVGATLSGSGSISSSGNLSESYAVARTDQESHTFSESVSQNVSYDIEQEAKSDIPPSAPPWGDPSNRN